MQKFSNSRPIIIIILYDNNDNNAIPMSYLVFVKFDKTTYVMITK